MEASLPARGALTAQPGRHLLVLAAAGLVALGVLALLLVLRSPLVTAIDPAVSQWWAMHRMPGLTAVLQLVTQVHSTIGIDLMLAAIVAGLAWRSRWRDALWLVLAVQASMLLNVLLKQAFARPRPVFDAALVHLETFSFPSGHALASTALWGCAVVLAPPHLRRAATVTAVVLVLLVAFSRVYLGAHFLSDVLAGMSEGLVCIAAAAGLRARLLREAVASMPH